MSEFMLLFQNSEFLVSAGMLVIAGAVSGVLAGLLGIGGGAVMVPVLYEFFGFLGVDDSVRTHVAVGTSLGIIVPTSISSVMSHHKRGGVDFAVLRTWFLPVIGGVVVGIFLMNYISGDALRLIFASVTLLLALKMVFNLDEFSLGTTLPGLLGMSIVGFIIGTISKLMGIGGGVIANNYLTLYGKPIHQAVATSAGLGLIISVPAVIGDIIGGWSHADILPIGSLGYVNFLGVLLMVPVSVLFAPLGVKIAHAMSQRVLEIAFAVFLFSVALRFFSSVL